MPAPAIVNAIPDQPAIAVPRTLEAALDPAFLSQALASVSGGVPVTSVEIVETLRTVATKLRFAVTFGDDPQTHGLCLKGLLDVDEMTARGGATCVLEGDFYCRIAPQVKVRVPEAVAVVTDREAQQSVLIMRDLIAAGAHFCSALEAFDADQALASLEQLAALHAGSALLIGAPWIRPRAAELARANYVSAAELQRLMDGPRGQRVPPGVLDAARLIEAVKHLANRDEGRPQFLIHGDSHAGNIFRTAEGSSGLIDWQLLQKGGWALDIAYHLCAVLPVELAEREERRLMNEYLAMMRGHGFDMPDKEKAWRQYREAVTYGYYLWAITRRVDPPIINLFFNRLGNAVARHDSFALLAVA
ncbi:MAG: aminoglycoside phosphotransferase family protein [Novosphingobium sp.]|nr:aminoglycoside phosphotransferase family protein [Novosphingobium sp.]